MFFADNASGARVEAWPKGRASCPLCRRLVLARCGEVVEWYWAHEQGASCDPWGESETPWHRRWKLRAEPDQREVVIGEHRADIRTPKGVIELQYSPISPEEICEREAFYGQMIWLLDGRRMVFDLNEFGIDSVPRLEPINVSQWSGLPNPAAGFKYWRWRRPRKSFLFAKQRIFIDLGDQVMEVADKLESPDLGFLLAARVESRERFLSRAGLCPPDASSSAHIQSFLVRYLPKDHVRTEESVGIQHVAKEPCRRWREFATLPHLEHWLAAREPAEHEVFEWLGSGHMTERQVSGSVAADGPK